MGIDYKNLEEEMFCLRFESKAMADLLIRGEAERWLYGLLWKEVENEHLERYRLASQYVKNKKVLDLACGCGYGSYLLADQGQALSVIGCDLDDDAIRYANHRFNHMAVQRCVGNAESFSFDDKFDVIVSFETIEHLNDYEAFLKGVKKSLIKNGEFIVSTPIARETNRNCRNPYHKIEWSFDDFIKLLSKYFTVEDIYLQSISFKKRKPTLIERIWKKVFPKEIRKDNNFYKLIKYSNNINVAKIDGGYQTVVCKNNMP